MKIIFLDIESEPYKPCLLTLQFDLIIFYVSYTMWQEIMIFYILNSAKLFRRNFFLAEIFSAGIFFKCDAPVK